MHIASLWRWSRSVARCRFGATAIEYALIGALICIVIVAALAGLGSAVSGLFDTVVATFPH